MNLDLSRPKNESKALLFKETEKCETPVEHTHRKPKETIDIQLTQPGETLSFKLSNVLGFDFSWLIGKTNLEVHNSPFNKTEETIKFKLYLISDLMNGGGINEKIRIEVEKNLVVSDIISPEQHDETKWCYFVEEFKKLSWIENHVGSFLILQACYKSSIFQDFKSFPELKLIWL